MLIIFSTTRNLCKNNGQLGWLMVLYMTKGRLKESPSLSKQHVSRVNWAHFFLTYIVTESTCNHATFRLYSYFILLNMTLLMWLYLVFLPTWLFLISMLLSFLLLVMLISHNTALLACVLPHTAGVNNPWWIFLGFRHSTTHIIYYTDLRGCWRIKNEMNF